MTRYTRKVAAHKPAIEVWPEDYPKRGLGGSFILPTRYRVCCLSLLIFIVSACGALHSENTSASVLRPARPNSSHIIVIGFVGGFVRHDDLRHSEVQLAQRLRSEWPTDRLQVAIFENRHLEEAHRTVRKWLDADDNGHSETENRNAHIILFGHSWGGSATVSLARELEKDGIPVLLTIQVDSVAKPGQNDRLIPANVLKAVNFYQTHGLLHGCSQITASDPSRTEILGNFRFEYKQEPTECESFPWFDRYVFKGHTSIGCDPHVWSRVKALIDSYVSPAPDYVSSETALY